jgi:hypothetical protein
MRLESRIYRKKHGVCQVYPDQKFIYALSDAAKHTSQAKIHSTFSYWQMASIF